MFKKLALSTVFAATFMAAIPATIANAKDELPLRRIIISTSGLANFEHVGQIEGNQEIGLPVRLDQVDDLLKSLVIFDAEGRLGAVTLPGRQPLTEAFRDLPFSREDLNSPAQLLNALQGTQVTIEGSTNITGQLVNVVTENTSLPDNAGTITQHRITLLSQSGLHTVVLENLEAVQFDDETVRNQISEALNALQEHRIQDERELDIRLLGETNRQVALAYVVDAPLWKSAYRLVLPQNDEEAGFLQAWAIFENVTGADWEDVEVTLISGNPVTYRQSLYESYYVDRPSLPVQVMGRVLPRTDTGAIAVLDDMARSRAQEVSMLRNRNIMGSMEMQESNGFGGGYAVADAAYAPMESMSMAVSAPPAPMAQIAMAAQSEEATTQLLFRFPERFDLAAGHSMMIPFISREMPMERVWLYQPDSNATHPFAAIKLENDTGTGLPPGILTLYEASASLGATNYVGDAELPVVPRGDERLIPFALDSKTLIDKEEEGDTVNGRMSISQGVLRQAITNVNLTHYTISAPEGESRTMIIEQPRRAGWDLITPDSDTVEMTNTHYRFRLEIPAGEVATLTARLEQETTRRYTISNLSYNQLVSYNSTTNDMSREMHRAFETMADMRRDIDNFNREINALDRQINNIISDQDRLRRNLSSVPSNSDLSRRYLNEMEEQENTLESLRTDVERKRTNKANQEAALNNYIAGLDID